MFVIINDRIFDRTNKSEGSNKYDVLLYRCKLLALVLTYIIKYMTFSLLFTLT